MTHWCSRSIAAAGIAAERNFATPCEPGTGSPPLPGPGLRPQCRWQDGPDSPWGCAVIVRHTAGRRPRPRLGVGARPAPLRGAGLRLRGGAERGAGRVHMPAAPPPCSDAQQEERPLGGRRQRLRSPLPRPGARKRVRPRARLPAGGSGRGTSRHVTERGFPSVTGLRTAGGARWLSRWPREVLACVPRPWGARGGLFSPVSPAAGPLRSAAVRGRGAGLAGLPPAAAGPGGRGWRRRLRR